jgi:ATP-dependent exoDNAse (exonuclease V) alpha subunit
LTSSTRARLPLAKQKDKIMAIYHLSVKAVSRSAGRSATAAAAYRAGCEITDQRTGEVHDYTRKGGVESADIVLPDGAPEWATDRAALWNAAEAAERRKDACVAREFEVALPDELSPAERRRLAVDFAKEMANREGCAVDVAIHAPGKEGDSRNHHAHILRTTRKVGLDGLTDKLDTEKAGRNRTADLDAVRTRWAELTNERLRENGIEARVDHRSLKDQGIDREPTSHMGPAVAAMERRGVKTEVGKRIEDEVADRLARARAEGDKERELAQANRSVIDLSGDLAAAKRDLAAAQLVGQAKTELVSGAADFRAKFMADRAAKQEQERQAEQARQAAERAQLEARRKAELERIAQELQRQARPRGPSRDNDGPDYSPGR